jgi:hypothetical protein
LAAGVWSGRTTEERAGRDPRARAIGEHANTSGPSRLGAGSSFFAQQKALVSPRDSRLLHPASLRLRRLTALGHRQTGSANKTRIESRTATTKSGNSHDLRACESREGMPGPDYDRISRWPNRCGSSLWLCRPKASSTHRFAQQGASCCDPHLGTFHSGCGLSAGPASDLGNHRAIEALQSPSTLTGR